MLHHISSALLESGDVNSFKQTIKIPANHDRIALVSACIPKSFYLVQAGYNTFQLDSSNIVVPIGNYTMNEFLEIVNGIVAPAWFGFSRLTGKMTLYDQVHTTLSFPEHSSMLNIMGFQHKQLSYQIIDGMITSTRVCCFEPISSVYICSDLISDPCGKYANMLYPIFIQGVGEFEFVVFQNPSVQDCAKTLALPKSDSDTLNSITCSWFLLDEHGRSLELNSIDWTIIIKTWQHEPIYKLFRNFVNFQVAKEQALQISQELKR